MGKAHGTLLASETKALTQRVLTFCFLSSVVEKNRGGFGGTIGQAYRRAEAFIPQRYQEEMRGLAEGAGIPLRHVQVANLFPELFHCSGFAMFGQATRDGPLLHGRVLDYMTRLGIQDYAVTIVQRPEGSQNAFVNVGYAGFVGSVTGMNERQIALGELGGRGAGQWDGMPMAFLLRKVLEEADTLEAAVRCFRETPRTCEYYYVVSDGKIPDARGLYGTPKTLRVLRPGQTYGKKLPDAVPDVVAFSEGKRLTALLKRIREGYGSFTPTSAIRLMDRPVAMESNLHDVLFAPQSLELWVAHALRPRAANYQACYQPHQHYCLPAMLCRMPAEAAPVRKHAGAGLPVAHDAATDEP